MSLAAFQPTRRQTIAKDFSIYDDRLIPVQIVIGKREAAARQVMLKLDGVERAMPVAEAIAQLQAAVA